MATTTTTGAKKIENSDQWGEIFDIHNDTVDAYDQLHEDTVEDYDDKIDDLSNAMGIVETGDVATHAIEAGQYVIWKRALYTADAAITIGETLAATGGSKNLTAVEKGGLNALNASLISNTLGKPYIITKSFSAPSGYSGFNFLKSELESAGIINYNYTKVVLALVDGDNGQVMSQAFIRDDNGGIDVSTYANVARSANYKLIVFYKD